MTGKTLWLTTPAHYDDDQRRAVLDQWYRKQLKAAVPALLAKWQPIVGEEAAKFIERTHNDRFVELMDLHMPDWRARRDELNGVPLADEEWGDGRAQ